MKCGGTLFTPTGQMLSLTLGILPDLSIFENPFISQRSVLSWILIYLIHIEIYLFPTVAFIVILDTINCLMQLIKLIWEPVNLDGCVDMIPFLLQILVSFTLHFYFCCFLFFPLFQNKLYILLLVCFAWGTDEKLKFILYFAPTNSILFINLTDNLRLFIVWTYQLTQRRLGSGCANHQHPLHWCCQLYTTRLLRYH